MSTEARTKVIITPLSTEPKAIEATISTLVQLRGGFDGEARDGLIYGYTSDPSFLSWAAVRQGYVAKVDVQGEAEGISYDPVSVMMRDTETLIRAGNTLEVYLGDEGEPRMSEVSGPRSELERQVVEAEAAASAAKLSEARARAGAAEARIAKGKAEAVAAAAKDAVAGAQAAEARVRAELDELKGKAEPHDQLNEELEDEPDATIEECAKSQLAYAMDNWHKGLSSAAQAALSEHDEAALRSAMLRYALDVGSEVQGRLEVQVKAERAREAKNAVDVGYVGLEWAGGDVIAGRVRYSIQERPDAAGLVVYRAMQGALRPKEIASCDQVLAIHALVDRMLRRGVITFE